MKDKTTAALLALFLGMFGIHRFYLRQPGLGILYFFLLFVGGISIVLGIIDAIVLLAMEPEEFERRYHDEQSGPGQYDRYRRGHVRRDYRSQQTTRSNRRQEPYRRPTPTQQPRPERANAAPLLQSGIRKYKEFDLEEAIEDFKKGLEIAPRDIALHFNIACAYSLTEQKELAFDHLDKAVQFGFSDFEKIKTHDDLAYVRIQPEFESFAESGFRLNQQTDEPNQTEPDPIPGDDKLLNQLKRLAELRDKGLITESEFVAEKEKLMR